MWCVDGIMVFVGFEVDIFVDGFFDYDDDLFVLFDFVVVFFYVVF